MLLALVLCFDHRKGKVSASPLDIQSSKGHKYIWYALSGYAVGLVTALSAGILTHSPQPALLYLVCHLLLVGIDNEISTMSRILSASSLILPFVGSYLRKWR